MDRDRLLAAIHPDLTIEQLVSLIPRAAALLRRRGIVCIQCGEPVWGTLREVAAEKGITDLAPILAELRAEARATAGAERTANGAGPVSER